MSEAETDRTLQSQRTSADTHVLTIAEAAKELRCSKAHLAKVLKGQIRGLPHLPHIRLGRRKVIRRTVLYQWMTQVERHQSDMLSALPEVRAV